VGGCVSGGAFIKTIPCKEIKKKIKNKNHFPATLHRSHFIFISDVSFTWHPSPTARPSPAPSNYTHTHTDYIYFHHSSVFS